MRVTTDASYRNLLRDLQRISERMQRSQLEISSGKKLHRPSDSPTAVSDVVRIQGERNETQQHLENIAIAKERLNFADGTLQNVQLMIERIRSLALRSTTDPTTAPLYTTEISQLRQQLLSAANSTYDAQFIFAGSNNGASPYVEDGSGNVTYTGDGEATYLHAGRTSKIQVHLPGSEIFSGSVDIFAAINDLVDAMNAGDTSATAAQVKKLEDFSTVAGRALAKIGGLVNAAQSLEEESNRYSLEQTAARSRLEDADLAAALTDYSQAETALRAATAAGARISNISILDYLA